MITQKAWYLWASSTVLCHLRLRVVMCQLLILQPVLVTYSRYSSSLRWSRTRSSFSRSFRTWSSLLMHSTQFAELVLMTPTSRSQSLPLKATRQSANLLGPLTRQHRRWEQWEQRDDCIGSDASALDRMMAWIDCEMDASLVGDFLGATDAKVCRY